MGIEGAVNVLNHAVDRGTAVVDVSFAVRHAACVGKQAQADGALSLSAPGIRKSSSAETLTFLLPP